MSRKVVPTETDILAVCEQQVPVRIFYEPRGNSRVSIGKKGVIIRISRYLNKTDKSKQVDEFKNWAARKIQQRPELCQRQRRDYYSGKIIAVRGRVFVLEIKFINRRVSRARVRNNIITTEVSTYLSEDAMEKTISLLISKCLAKELHPWAQERLKYLNELYFPLKRFTSLRLKLTNSLWGSCSHHGNITLSTRLLLAPDFVIDYVMVHELAHLFVRNHSKKFWDVVARALPDFEKSEKWLREYGKRCEF